MDVKIVQDGFNPVPNLSGFSAHVGTIYEKGTDEDFVRALPIEEHHLNPEGVVHGGVLLSFMDYVIYRAIGDEISHDVIFSTVNLNTNFLAAAKVGEIVFGSGKISRKTKSVIFAEGLLYTEDRDIMTGMGVWKIISK